MRKIFLVIMFIVFASGCVTTTSLVLPQGASLHLKNDDKIYENGDTVKRRPIFWNQIRGVPYMMKNPSGEVIETGKLPVKFRISSIFWPPYAEIYWPLGFASKETRLDNEQCADWEIVNAKSYKVNSK